MPYYPPAAARPPLVSPGGLDPAYFNIVGALGVNAARLVRVTVPRTGNLRDLTIYVAVSSGNVSCAVYDTGDTLAGSRTKLWDSGSVACGAANAYQLVGDPNLAVKADQQLDLGFSIDNATATTARWNPGATNLPQLPTAFNVVPGGALPKMSALGANLSPFGTWPRHHPRSRAGPGGRDTARVR